MTQHVSLYKNKTFYTLERWDVIILRGKGVFIVYRTIARAPNLFLRRGKSPYFIK